MLLLECRSPGTISEVPIWCHLPLEGQKKTKTKTRKPPQNPASICPTAQGIAHSLWLHWEISIGKPGIPGIPYIWRNRKSTLPSGILLIHLLNKYLSVYYVQDFFFFFLQGWAPNRFTPSSNCSYFAFPEIWTTRVVIFKNILSVFGVKTAPIFQRVNEIGR